MNTKTKYLTLITLAIAGLLVVLLATKANVATAQTPSGAIVTRMDMSNRWYSTSLDDAVTGASGSVSVSVSEDTGSVWLDFRYVGPDPAYPDLWVFKLAIGQIPADALTFDRTSAHLALTTPTFITTIRCGPDPYTGEYDCLPTGPMTLDLTWVADGLYSYSAKVKSVETFGPLTTRFQGDYGSVSAPASGTWEGMTSYNAQGWISESRDKTSYREVTIVTNP